MVKRALKAVAALRAEVAGQENTEQVGLAVAASALENLIRGSLTAGSKKVDNCNGTAVAG